MSKNLVAACLLSLIAASLQSATAAAQGTSPTPDDVQGQLWADYHAHFYRTKKQEFYGDTGFRYGGGSAEFFTAYLRPSIRYHHTKNLRYRFSLGAFYTDRKESDNTLEIRPAEGIQVNWPTLQWASVINLVRLEQRLVYDLTTREWSYQSRLRYQIGTAISLSRIPWSGLFMPLSAEFFWDYGDVFYYSDEVRVTAGLGRVLGKSWIVDAVLTWEETRANADEAFTQSDIIFRVQVKQLLSQRNFFNRVEAPDN